MGGEERNKTTDGQTTRTIGRFAQDMNKDVCGDKDRRSGRDPWLTERRVAGGRLDEGYVVGQNAAISAGDLCCGPVVGVTLLCYSLIFPCSHFVALRRLSVREYRLLEGRCLKRRKGR